MRKLRYIDLGLIDPNLIDALWEYSRIIIPECPTVFSFTPNKQMILVTNLYNLDKYFYMENISKEVNIERLYIPNSASGNVLYEPNSTLIFSIHFPNDNDSNVIKKAIMAAKIKVLQKYKIASGEAPYRVNSFDLCYQENGKYKKFGSHISKKWDNWTTFGSFMSFDINLDLARKIYKIDTDKFKKKGAVFDIGDVVGGLHKINSKIGTEIAPEIVQKIANRFNLEFIEDKLTDEENSKIKILADKLNNKDWKLYGKHPDIN